MDDASIMCVVANLKIYGHQQFQAEKRASMRVRDGKLSDSGDEVVLLGWAISLDMMMVGGTRG